jgi:hypothetical protein
LSNPHFSHAVAVAEAMQEPPSSPVEPPEPPVPEPPLPVDVDEPVEPAVPLDAPPSVLSVVSVVHAPRTTITADAHAQPVIFFIVSLLAMGYFKPPTCADSGAVRPPSSTARMIAPGLSHDCFG